MESIDVNYGGLKRYDTAKPPLRQRKVFTAILRALCGLSMMGQEYKIEKINMEGLKPPYILLSNHMYFVDFHLCSIATCPIPSTTSPPSTATTAAPLSWSGWGACASGSLPPT